MNGVRWEEVLREFHGGRVYCRRRDVKGDKGGIGRGSGRGCFYMLCCCNLRIISILNFMH